MKHRIQKYPAYNNMKKIINHKIELYLDMCKNMDVEDHCD